MSDFMLVVGRCQDIARHLTYNILNINIQYYKLQLKYYLVHKTHKALTLFDNTYKWQFFKQGK